MNDGKMTRRDLLQTGAAAAALCAAGTPAKAAESKSPRDLKIGMATNGFRGQTNAELAEGLAAAGIQTVQLFFTQTDSKYWVYNGRNDVSDMTPERCKQVAGAYRAAGLSIHSLAVYTNLIHPDPEERKANLAYFEAMMEIGDHMDVRTFITEAGHYHDAEHPCPRVEQHYQEDVWKQMVATGRELAKMAERHDATVLFEPFYRHFFSSAKRTRIYLEEIGSPRIRALLDPANLLEVNDLPEMFQQLGPLIDCLHAKDRKLHVDRGVAAGLGDLDYVEFVKLAAKYTPHAPLILEYVGAADYKQALSHLRESIAKAS